MRSFENFSYLNNCSVLQSITIWILIHITNPLFQRSVSQKFGSLWIIKWFEKCPQYTILNVPQSIIMHTCKRIIFTPNIRIFLNKNAFVRGYRDISPATGGQRQSVNWYAYMQNLIALGCFEAFINGCMPRSSFQMERFGIRSLKRERQTKTLSQDPHTYIHTKIA